MDVRESAAGDQVGLQFSVYPLRQEHLHGAIEAAAQAATRAGLDVRVGQLSSFAPGDEEAVFAGLRAPSTPPARSGRRSWSSPSPAGCRAARRSPRFRTPPEPEVCQTCPTLGSAAYGVPAGASRWQQSSQERHRLSVRHRGLISQSVAGQRYSALEKASRISIDRPAIGASFVTDIFSGRALRHKLHRGR